MKTLKNWAWFLIIMAIALGLGIHLAKSRRADLGKSFDYSLVEYRVVDPALIKYTELEPILPRVAKISALALAEDGRILIAGENAIEIVDGEIIPFEGTVKGLTVDEQGVIYAGAADHVVVLRDGESTAWPSPDGKPFLTSIDTDPLYVYVADAGNRRIWRYPKKGGEPLEIGKKDGTKEVPGFSVPSPYFDLAVSPADGSFWAVNPGRHALENYRPDGMPLSSWQASGMKIEGFSGCCNPSHFALLPDGGFVTTEKGLPRVKIHNVDGSFRCVVAAPDQFDEGVVGLDVAVDDEGIIYVLDPSRNQIRVFEEKK